MFKIKSTRLRCEGKTRWSSAFLNLKSIYNANKKISNFSSHNDCPLTKENIEFYLQVLLPAYRFTIVFQQTSANISQVIPSLLSLFNTWNKLALKKKYFSICNLLIDCFKNKFEYELNSNAYLVSALLNTSKLKYWYNESYSEHVVEKDTNAIVDVLKDYCIKRTDEKTTHENDENNNNESEEDLNVYNDDDLFFNLFSNNEEIINEEETKTCISDFRNEKNAFIKLLKNTLSLGKKSTVNFWLDNKSDFPNLFTIVIHLLGIPASSAFIERFFSICGVVCKKRTGNMSDNLLITRSFIKCNLPILKEFKK